MVGCQSQYSDGSPATLKHHALSGAPLHMKAEKTLYFSCRPSGLPYLHLQTRVFFSQGKYTASKWC